MKAAKPHFLYSAALAAGMAITVGTALAFEHLGGFIPCKLCLEQRIPYYAGIPLMLLAAVLSATGRTPALVRLLLAAGAALMLWGLVLAVYHSGVEWQWWAGPDDCGIGGASPAGSGQGVLDLLDEVVPPACDQAAGRFLGLSFAGWNALASLVLAAIAIAGALHGGRRSSGMPQGSSSASQ
jgi:disulfide bond formation protein DsbB